MTRARAINLTAELNGIPGLKDRTPDTMPATLEAKAFGRTHAYRDGFVSTVKYSGTSAWERHADEEILIVADGVGYLHLIDEDGFQVPRSLSANLLVIIPPNVWHQVQSDSGISLVTITPQPTTHQAERP